ncbi:MAG: UDP-N-acetylmuramoyl-L-alanyl-D-glutamate--2,6-diaminopimelate ligase [Sandaracinus sp.]|nr:UDP-N-acetylmuramoyl-L-alanyl-D-glutamate--2,6-diaminopimelate ligase [Sandaracinus sp.]
MKLSELQRRVGGTIVGDDVEVRDVHRDSRRVAEGDLFAAIVGANVDGTSFVPAAKERGAAAVLAERATELPTLVVPSVRDALGPVAHTLAGDPTKSLAVVGVTGTNGKTTTTYLIDAALAALGHRPALLGTVASRAGAVAQASSFTTPEADDLARFAKAALDQGLTHLVMEVSSHALAQGRVGGASFAVGAFTNLTQDHLDFHGTMEAYGEAKATLFTDIRPTRSVIHVDDAFGAKLAARVPGAITVGTADGATLRVTKASFSAAGIEAQLQTPEGALVLRSALVGRHNLENLLVALGCLVALGIPAADALSALQSAPAAPGRLEPVADPRGVTVLVDYAHTPDALANALRSVRPITEGRVIVVFGCGGDRDAGKRPLMGRAAAEGADLVVVTSDNPRTEDPVAIVDAIVPGVLAGGKARLESLDGSGSADEGFVVEVDREKAIGLALAAARSGDTVLLAGKGHEDYQIVGTQKRDFDDRKVAASFLATLAGGAV